MKIFQYIACFCVISSTLAAQNLRVVNAASLSSVSVAPGSIITIFGTKLTNGVSVASNVQSPPTSLGGVTVTIGGTSAALFYVSPTQINAVVGPKTPTGSDAVSIVSPTGTQTGTVTVAAPAPPGLFSLFGTGTRDGAIVNALLGNLMNFSTQTSSHSTFLALFATGMDTTTPPTVTIGGVPVQVTFAGASPCCDGLQQINLVLPDSLAGAGRVPVVVTAGGQTSNTVQIVLLPSAANKEFSDDQDNQQRNRELSALAYIPGTSLVISADENDDVVRVIDVGAKTVAHVVSLPKGAHPSGVAVNAAGTLAVVTETGLGKVAIVDLAKFAVTTEVATGSGPTAVAIAGTQAVVVNQDVDSVSVIDLTSDTVQKTIPVGRGPAGVAAASGKAYVTNEDDGTVSVIDLAGLTVTQTIQLGASVRAEAIALVGGFAYITEPAAGPDGMVVALNLSNNQTNPIPVNPDRSGGSSDIAYFNGKLYFANQSGGSVSVQPVEATTGAANGAITKVKVDLGARALAIDAKDGLLVVSNEGTGTLVLVSLSTNAVTGRINAVRTSSGDDQDDDSDHNQAANLPRIQSLSPATGKAGTTFTLTITGVNLTGATAVDFNANGNGKSGDFTVKNIQVASGGTLLTATVTIDASAKPGARLVTVTTPNGDSADKGEGAAVFVVTP
jgi:uncharacterized protein (TIGR03437 family)